MLRAAVVGVGWWGKQIVTSLEGSERIRITRAVDVAHNEVKPFTDAHGLPLAADISEVLTDADIDAVIIATPHLLHEPMVLAAAEAGKQIFCEKPLALSAAGAERMLAACDAKGIVLGVGHERRFEGAWEELLRMAESGELGTLLHIECNTSHNRFAGAPASSWRQDPAQAPAGTMTALGIHVTDFYQTLGGPVAEVFARMAHRSETFPKDDIVSIQFAFANGMTGTLVSLATTPFYQRMTLFGDKGWAEVRETTNVDEPDPAVLTWRGLDEEIHTRTFKATDTVGANFEAWAAAIEGAGTYRISRAEKLHNIQILEAIVRSTETGRPEAVGAA